MTLTEFAALVQEMRDAQKLFFGGLRTQTHFTKCQNIEKKVDSALLLIKGKQGTQAPISFAGFDDYEG